MIMALSAADGETVERGAHHLDRIGDVRVLRGRVIHLASAVGGHAEETGGGKLLDGIGGEVFIGLRNHFIARELLPYELVEGFILVQRLDDIVTILPGPFTLEVLFAKALAVRITGRIQPVAPPAFAIVRRGEEAVDESEYGGFGITNRIGHKGLHLLRRGRQAQKIKTRAADEGDWIGLAREGEAFFGQFGLDEAVEALFGLRRNRLEGPPRPLLIGEGMFRPEFLRLGAGGLGAGGDPLLQDGNVAVFELRFALWHLAGLHQLDEMAFRGITRNDRRAAFAAFLNETGQPHIEAAFGLTLFTVAVKAVRLQNRAYILFKGQSTSGSPGGSGRECGEKKVAEHAQGIRACAGGSCQREESRKQRCPAWRPGILKKREWKDRAYLARNSSNAALVMRY